jgi:hypothetical protein
VSIVLKSWSLKLLEPSGPVQVCKGIIFFYLKILSWGDKLWSLDRIGTRCAVLDGNCPAFEVLDETTLGLYSITGFEMFEIYLKYILNE